MRWLSIIDVQMLIKRGFYWLETGVEKNLIYDRNTKKFVGHIDNKGFFAQDKNYEPDDFILKLIDNEVQGHWGNNNSW